MFSAGLPCLAYDYHCINELVNDGTNGRLFKNSDELCNQLFDTLKGFKFDTKTPLLANYRSNLSEFGRDSWDDQWKAVMIPSVIQNNKANLSGSIKGLNKKEL